jgi:hypothetical protein
MSSETKTIFILTLSGSNHVNLNGGGTNLSISEHGELVQEWDYIMQEPDDLMGTRENHCVGTSVMYPEHVSEICLSKRFITDDVTEDGEELYVWRVTIFGLSDDTFFNFRTKREAREVYSLILDWKRKYSAK